MVSEIEIGLLSEVQCFIFSEFNSSSIIFRGVCIRENETTNDTIHMNTSNDTTGIVLTIAVIKKSI